MPNHMHITESDKERLPRKGDEAYPRKGDEAYPTTNRFQLKPIWYIIEAEER